MYVNRHKGFTLIEVLIAAVILFMVIAVTTLVYRSALLSSRKAEQVIAITGYLPIIIDQVSENLLQQDNGSQPQISGNGEVMQVEYQWQAKLIQAKAAPSVLDSFTGELVTQDPRFRLWQIDIELKSGTANRQYQYEELTYPVLQ